MSSKRIRIMSLSVITAVVLAGCGAQSQQQSSTPNTPSSASSGSASPPNQRSSGGSPSQSPSTASSQSRQPSASGQPPSSRSSSSAPSSGGSPSTGSSTDQSTGTLGTGGSGRSAAEEVAAKEAIFQGSVSDYDGFILKEREHIANRRNQAGSEDDLEDYEGPLFEGAGGAGGSSQAEQEGSGSAYETGSSGGGYRPEGPGDNRQGDFDNTRVSTPPPADIPSGDDDDVVARQIREAAEKETDPQLREALWEEYRKYKNQKK